jgi:hypothetical protein
LLFPTLLEADIYNSGISDFAANSVFVSWHLTKSAQVLLSYLKPNISAKLRPALQCGATYISDFKHPQALSSFTSTHLLRSSNTFFRRIHTPASDNTCSTTLSRAQLQVIHGYHQNATSYK